MSEHLLMFMFKLKSPPPPPPYRAVGAGIRGGQAVEGYGSAGSDTGDVGVRDEEENAGAEHVDVVGRRRGAGGEGKARARAARSGPVYSHSHTYSLLETKT